MAEFSSQTLDNTDAFYVRVAASAGPGTPATPEHALLIAIVEDVKAILEKGLSLSKAAQARRDRARVEEAYVWLMSDDERSPFSFVNVAMALRIDPSAARMALIGQLKQMGKDYEQEFRTPPCFP